MTHNHIWSLWAWASMGGWWRAPNICTCPIANVPRMNVLILSLKKNIREESREDVKNFLACSPSNRSNGSVLYFWPGLPMSMLGEFMTLPKLSRLGRVIPYAHFPPHVFDACGVLLVLRVSMQYWRLIYRPLTVTENEAWHETIYTRC